VHNHLFIYLDKTLSDATISFTSLYTIPCGFACLCCRFSYFIFPFPLILYLADFEDIVTNINSVSTSPTETGETWKHTSLQGGAYLYIKGSGFSTRSPLSNRVTIGDLNCPVIGNFL